jgi:flagellar hook-associated protein 2
MPAFTMPGMASGQDTNTMVKQLVELEKKPIKRWEMENVYSKAQMEAWAEVRKRTSDLQTKTRNLTTFTSPLATKKLVPSVEGVLSGEATRGAKAGKKSIEILELASKHQISGRHADLNKKIKEGKFTIVSGKEKIELEFQGGSLTDLANLIKNSAASVANTHLVRVNSEEGIISLTAVKSGKKNQLKFMDPDGILNMGGLVGEYTPPPEAEKIAINLDPGSMEAYETENFENNLQPEWKPLKEETGLKIHSATAFAFPLPAISPKEQDKLKFEITGETKPPRLDIVVYFKGEGESEERFRNASLYPVDDSYEWLVSESIYEKTITKLVLKNSGDKAFSIVSVALVSEPEWLGAEPANIIAEATDAVFKIDGIEIRRDKNEDINDVLESVSFNFHKITEEPITFDIEPDTKKGKDLIVEFVQSYNELLKLSKEATFVDRDGKLKDKDFTSDRDRKANIDKDFWENKENTGLLAGDNSILRLTSGMKTIISGAYPNKQERGYKTLAEIGISTGGIGSNWEKIQDGMLQIDDELLSKALNENPEAVKELFAADLNNDAITDEGVGYRLVEHLKPYNQFAGGLITGKVKFLEEKISDNKKKIKNHEAHMLAYENKLKQKFLHMEQGVGKNKGVSNYLQNNLGGAQQGR